MSFFFKSLHLPKLTHQNVRFSSHRKIPCGKILLVFFVLFAAAACRTPFNQPQTPAQNQTAVSKSKKVTNNRLSSEKRLRRKRVSVSRNLYEGSLWRYESSFGNILRDHRARFRGDLFTISELPSVVNVPEPKAEAEQEAQLPQTILSALTCYSKRLPCGMKSKENKMTSSAVWKQCPHGLPKFCPMAT